MTTNENVWPGADAPCAQCRKDHEREHRVIIGIYVCTDVPSVEKTIFCSKDCSLLFLASERFQKPLQIAAWTSGGTFCVQTVDPHSGWPMRPFPWMPLQRVPGLR